MPNLIAHRIFIDRLIEDASLSETERDALRLGTQGPDPLFYYGIVPWRAWHYLAAVKRYGNEIHRTNGEEFLNRLSKQVDLIKDEGEKKTFSAFVMGQIAHLFLDRALHPFVYYFSGFDKEGKLTGEFHFEHAHFESRIDSALLERYEVLGFSGRTETLLPYNKSVTKVVDKYLTPVIREMFNAKLSKKYYTNSLKNIRSMQRMTRNKFVKFVSGRRSMFNALFTPKKAMGDPLNLTKEEWCNPVTKKLFDLNFIELMEQEIQVAAIVFKEYFQTKKIPNINTITDERSYKGVEVGARLTYWKNNEE